MSSRRAVTLVEMLMVILILGTLATIAAVGAQQGMHNSKRIAMEAKLRTFEADVQALADAAGSTDGRPWVRSTVERLAAEDPSFSVHDTYDIVTVESERSCATLLFSRSLDPGLIEFSDCDDPSALPNICPEPAPTTSLAASPGTESGTVDITWAPPADERVDHLRVEMADLVVDVDRDGAGELPGEVTVSGLVPAATYNVSVKSGGACGYSAPSGPVSVAAG